MARWVNRAVILWVLAIVLTVFAVSSSLNAKRSRESIRLGSLVAQGFDSTEDARRIEKLLNQGPLRSIDDVESALLQKYAFKPGVPSSMAIGIIAECASPEVARALAPTVKRLMREQPDRQLVQQIPIRWRENGLVTDGIL